jgi:hypothetical protein
MSNIKHIMIGGENRPILFGFGAFSTFEEITGSNALDFIRDFSQMKMKSSEVVALVYSGLENAATYHNTPVQFTVKQVGAWCDIYGSDLMNIVIPMAVKALGLNVDENEPTDKKKVKAQK